MAVKQAAAEGKEILTGENVRFVVGLVVLLAALYLALSMVSFFLTGTSDQTLLESGLKSSRDISNWGGMLGARVSYSLVNDCFGIASVIIPVFLVMVSLRLMKIGRVRLWKWFANFAFLIIWFSVALQYFIPDSVLNDLFFIPGGRHGRYVCDVLMSNLGKPGAFFVLLVAAVIYFIYLSDETVRMIKRAFSGVKSKVVKKGENTAAQGDAETSESPEEAAADAAAAAPATAALAESGNPDAEGATAEAPSATEEIAGPEAPQQGEEADGQTESPAEGQTDSVPPYDPRMDLEHYEFPPISLLRHYDLGGQIVDDAEKHANEERIRTTLQNFGVEIDTISATVGPTVTLYEITPASGVRISKIRNLEDDIALSLSALGIRIIAPIPGKGTIGIEVPNRRPQIVSMESVINTPEFRNFKGALPVVIGKTITNEPFMFDLAKAPHLLVAGATGQGKSVGLNAIIASLLYRKHPSELKLVLIDPKKVEFSIYSPLENHFLATVPDGKEEPIITDIDRVVYALTSLCKEMDTRYSLLKKGRVRTIKEYNERFCQRRLNPEKGHHYMPYIVVVVDEFADLIMTAGKTIETPIARLAQLGRAAGIHVIIATQRPTANIITGTIKANFPARIAFKTSAAVDSRTILDRTGANRLVGRGDMLYLAGGEPVRVQCAFIDTPEVEDLTNYIARQQGYPGPFELPEVQLTDGATSSAAADDGESMHLDPLFEEAAKLVVEMGQGSTSNIQRKFSIGYNRAGRIMDQLQRAGIVGPQVGSKPREVLCSSQMDLDAKISNAL